MHFQSPIQNWPSTLSVAPDHAFIKAFEGGMLVEAKKRWSDLGRDPKKLHTDFRFYNFIYPFDKEYTFTQYKAIWRENFWRFVDRTYLEHYSQSIDNVESLNEHTDSRMCLDPVLLKPHLMAEQAAVAVWNDEFRGKVVNSPDGGRGLIPAGTRLVICNSPVGNDIPKEFYQLAVDSDSILGVHPYSKWVNKQRDPQDFRFHSGRWSFNEAEYGIKPVYAFTECGPYFDAGKGWRSDDCMGEDVPLLAEGMKQWIRDVAGTNAYRENRILGPGAFFTSGGFGWPFYRLETSQLIEIYNAIDWKPMSTHFTTPSLLNVRMFPWLGTVIPAVQRQIAKGTQVKVEGFVGGWACISHNGNEWVNGKYLSPL